MNSPLHLEINRKNAPARPGMRRQRPAFLLWLLCLSLAPSLLPGQVLTDPRDVPEAFRAEPKLLVGFDSKRSFISNRDVKLLGIKAGLDFDQKVRTGFGIYFLSKGFTRSFIIPDDSGGLDTIRSALGFAYMSVWVEYVFLQTKRWEISFPWHFGFGEAQFEGFEAQTHSPVFLTELSVLAQYKIFPWIGLGAGFGFRQTLAGNPTIRENFNAPIYRFGIKLFLGYFWKKVFPPKG